MVVLPFAGFYLGYEYRKNSTYIEPIANTKQIVPVIKKTASKTEIVKYKQTYVPEKSINGYCWTESIATSNPTAWRCMDDNKDKNTIGFIYDPCFETDSGQVVCGVDPEKEGSGFELKLTKALPKESRTVDMRGDTPWIVKLENGTYCYSMTGTAASANNEFAYYECSKNMYLLSGKDTNSTFNKSGEYWKVRVVTLPNGKESDKEFPVQNINVIKALE